jgi:chemotaxis protein MotA
MLLIIGYLVIIACVLGGYLMSGGHMAALIQPFEFLIIAGAAFGAFIVSNNPKVIKATFKAALSTLKASNHTKKFYVELLLLFFELTNTIRRDGVLAVEADVEKPNESKLFTKYPLVLREKRIMEFFCDHLRLIITGRVDVMHLEALMDEDIETFESEGELPVHAITRIADSLPAFGIVAAVMGVVITMQQLGAPPEELGHHIAKALVGTFLGVLLGYGFIAPVSSILENRLHAEIVILQSIKAVLLASIHNLAPAISVEFARKMLYSAERPTAIDLEVILKEAKAGRSSAAASTPEANKTEATT